MKLYFKDILPYFPDLLSGLGMSILITLISIVIGIFVGIIVYFGKTSSNKILRGISIAYIECIRNTPLLVQLYILYFGLSQFGVDISAFLSAAIAMIINTGAYAAEILRSGFKSVKFGTVEAGYALGMTKLQTFYYVVLLPGLKSAFPALINQFVLLFLFSSVASTIALPELFHQVQNVDTKTARTFEVLIIAGAMYYIASVTFIKLFRTVEKKIFKW